MKTLNIEMKIEEGFTHRATFRVTTVDSKLLQLFGAISEEIGFAINQVQMHDVPKGTAVAPQEEERHE